jgi:4-hydroxy-tetrahydrodipicolinate synthase
MLTPFDAEGRIDCEKTEALAEFLIAKGVHGLFPLGTTGEMFKLSVAERKAIAGTVVKQARQRVPVYIHAGAMTQEDTLELAKHACEIGADGIAVVTPAFMGVNDAEVEQYYVTIASSLPEDFPIYLYNIPQRTGNDIKPEVAARIAARCKNVIGIKYSLADFLRTYEYMAINNGSFSVLQGADRLFLPVLGMGCVGTISSVSSVFPELLVGIYDAFIRQDLAKAKELQAITNRYSEIMKSGSNNMAYFKETLKLRGIDIGILRVPQLGLTRQEASSLREQLEAYNRVTGLDFYV